MSHDLDDGLRAECFGGRDFDVPLWRVRIN